MYCMVIMSTEKNLRRYNGTFLPQRDEKLYVFSFSNEKINLLTSDNEATNNKLLYIMSPLKYHL